MYLPLPTLFLELLGDNYSNDHFHCVFRTISDTIINRYLQQNLKQEELDALWDVLKEFITMPSSFCAGEDIEHDLITS